MTITAADLGNLRALCEKATPGPWLVSEVPGRECLDEDSAFIAAARTALPALLAEVEEARALLANAAKLTSFYDHPLSETIRAYLSGADREAKK